MTKLREPGSLKDALFLAIGLLGKDKVEAITGFSYDHVRVCSDPNGEREASGATLLALNSALSREGHPQLFADVFRREAAELAAGADALGMTLDPLKRLGVLAEEFAALAGSINQAADDETLSPAERREILRRAVKLETAVHALIGGLRPPVVMKAARPRGRG